MKPLYLESLRGPMSLNEQSKEKGIASAGKLVAGMWMLDG